MKKGSIIVLCIGCGLFIIGLLLCLALVIFGVRPGVMLSNGDLSFNVNDFVIGIRGDVSIPVDDPAEKGTVYELQEDIDSLNINWVSGEIIIQVSEDGSVSFYEEWDGTISKSDALSYYISGSKLSIEWDKNVAADWLNINNPVSKRLVVSVPESLKGVYINATSAEVYVRDIDIMGRLEINTVSGDISVENSESTYVLMDTTSGEQRYYGECKSIDMNAVSGNCSFVGSCNDLGFSSVSGDIFCELGKLPDNIEIDTVSGDSELDLPEEPDFELEFDTVSGELYCDLPMRFGDGEYICGSGRCEIDFDSTSGDITIK